LEERSAHQLEELQARLALASSRLTAPASRRWSSEWVAMEQRLLLALSQDPSQESCHPALLSPRQESQSQPCVYSKEC
jgi:hypothetical protein